MVSTSSEPQRINRDAAERVLRRAVELDDSPRDPGVQLSVEALVEAAADLGMDPSFVQRAVAEEQAGLLEPHVSPLDRFAGPRAISASRIVDQTLGDAVSLVDDWLRRAWAFRRVRGADTDSLYRRRTDPAAAVQRAVRSISGKDNADKVRQLRVFAHSISPERTLVALVADMQGSRTAAEVSGASLGGAGVVASTATALVNTPWLWLGVPASVALGLGVMVGRKTWTNGIDDDLEGLLDKVEKGTGPEAVLGQLTGRLLGDVGRRAAPH